MEHYEGMIYDISGYVYGRTWEFTKGFYLSRKYHGRDLDMLKTIIEQDFKDGSLDSGYGFESLIGAVLYVTSIDTRIIDDKEFHNTQVSSYTIGELPDNYEEIIEHYERN